MNARPKCGAAFTLIGLLVVIAIIAFLALLPPAFANANASGQGVHSLTNLPQLQMGWYWLQQHATSKTP